MEAAGAAQEAGKNLEMTRTIISSWTLRANAVITP
jgi:hypothetical protein